jgi:hypothetical protein
MFMIDYKELSWQYWFVTACLLTAGVAGYKIGFLLAIGLTVFQLIHFTIREQGITSFPVQVRFWYLFFYLLHSQSRYRLCIGCLLWERGHN